MWSIQSQPNVTLHQLVDQILAEQKLLDIDRNKINRIFDQVSTGRLKLID